MCGFATNDVRASEYHFGSRHHALLSWQKKPPSRVLVQHVDRQYFEVKGDFVVEAKEDVEEAYKILALQEVPEMVGSVSNGIPGFLHHWMECHAIICKLCANRPILCRSTVISHVRQQHTDEEAFQDLEAFEHRLNVVEPLAQEPENIRLPNPWLGVQSFLQPPNAGYACSSKSCGWASDDLEKMREHESTAHAEEIRLGERTQVMIQYVTLLERVYFPVARFSDVQEVPQYNIEPDTNDSNDFQNYLDSLKVKPQGRDAEADDISLWAPNTGKVSGTGKLKTTSIAESDQTHRSIVCGREFMDTYTVKERYDILASLWNSPSAAELKPLGNSEVRAKIRNLVMRDKEEAINEAKRFDTVFRQTLLATQHEIIELEEAMSQGTRVPSEILRKILTEYGESFCE